MEENAHFWHIMPYYFKKDKHATKMQKRVCAVCAEGAVTDQMCQSGLRSVSVTSRRRQPTYSKHPHQQSYW